MPRKKKSAAGTRGASDNRSDFNFEESLNGGAALTYERSTATTTTTTMSEDSSSQSHEEIVRSMQEMFSHLEPEVIYIVLSEAEFKVENAMDALLELSNAAEAKTSVALSGFEMAAAILDPDLSYNKLSSETNKKSAASHCEESKQVFSSDTIYVTEELDSLIDQEVETLMMSESQPNNCSLSSLPDSFQSSHHPSQKQVNDQKPFNNSQHDPKLGFLSMHSSPYKSNGVKTQGATSPVNELSLRGGSLTQGSEALVDYSYLSKDSSSADTRTSASQDYHRPDRLISQGSAQQSVQHNTSWNIQAPVFLPSIRQPTFFMPVLLPPNPWATNPAIRNQLLASRVVSNAHVRPPMPVSAMGMIKLKLEGQVLVLLRGAPGSGKSTLARAMLEQNPGGIVLSTDDFFTRNGVYQFEPNYLGEAHAWNHQRAQDALVKGLSPIIIDNTNMQCWEMKPYVAMALRYKYRVLFREPNTWWKFKPQELEKRSKHGVTKEKIKRMIENMDRYVSVHNIMGSQEKSTAVYGVDVSQCDQSLQPPQSHPDVVSDSVLTKHGSQLSSSLPDVSSLDNNCSPSSSNVCLSEGSPETNIVKESLSTVENVSEEFKAADPDLPDMADLDPDLDASSPISAVDNCETNEDWGISEINNMSIGQRVRREREHSRIVEGDATCEPPKCDLSCQNAGLNDSTTDLADINDCIKPVQQDFVGDWPFQSLEQRNQGKSQTLKKPDLEVMESDDRSLMDLDFKASNECIPNPLNCLYIDETQITKGKKQDSICSGREKMHVNIEEETQTDISGSGSDLKSEAFADSEIISSCVQILPQKLELNQDTSSICETVLENHQRPNSGSSGNLAQVNQPNFNIVSTQTDPQDFALLWRITHQKSSEPDLGNSFRKIVVLEGNPMHFVAKVNKENSPEQQLVPYRVCHEKGSQVGENDLKELLVKQHSLEILSHLFKRVPMTTLEDLFEKCSQDIDWTTNLLLDSGECLNYESQSDLVSKKDLVQMAKNDLDIKSALDTIELAPGEGIEEQMKMLNISNESSLPVPDFDGETQDKRGNDEQNKNIKHSSNADQIETESEQSSQEQVANNYVDGAQAELNKNDTGDGEGETDVETMEEISAITQSLLTKLEEMDLKKEEERKKRQEESRGHQNNGSMNIQTLELKLSTEFALQLTELFGPVGTSPGEFSPGDCSVLLDLKLAKLLHQKWKETIEEKQIREALSYHFLQESSLYMGESLPALDQQGDFATDFFLGTEDYSSLFSQSASQDVYFMDQWNVNRQPVSLRDIMVEEQAMQDILERSRVSQVDLNKKDGATVLKENQLFSLFPTIDRHFLRDILQNNNYSLEQTVQFLHLLLDDEPVRNVVASTVTHEVKGTQRASSKERKQKSDKEVIVAFQDTEDPEYEDYRTEAVLQRRRQQECFDKAAEAYRQGRKDVASFYAQQGHLHGQKMKEANHRAAVQIFKRVNATLLPQNVLDLHGLHVDEALHHLQQVLSDKTLEWQQGLCRPQLSVITGRGNHSQGGVARIRPAVLDYLKSKHYRFVETKPGLLLITLH